MVYEHSIDPKGNRLQYNAMAFAFQSDNTFYFNSKKTFTGSLNFIYHGAKRGYIYVYFPRYILDAGIKYQMFDKRLQVGFNASNILNINDSRVKTLPDTIIPFVSDVNTDSRNVRVFCTYAFGSGKKNKKKKSNEEELKRL